MPEYNLEQSLMSDQWTDWPYSRISARHMKSMSHCYWAWLMQRAWFTDQHYPHSIAWPCTHVCTRFCVVLGELQSCLFCDKRQESCVWMRSLKAASCICLICRGSRTSTCCKTRNIRTSSSPLTSFQIILQFPAEKECMQTNTQI